MKIGIDLRPLQSGHRFRGIGTYISSLIRALSKTTGHSYVFYLYKGDNPLTKAEFPRNFNYQLVWLTPPRVHALVTALKTTATGSFKINQDIDVFLAPDISFGLPSTKVPIVAVCYDLMPHLFRDQMFPRAPLRLFKTVGPKGLAGTYLRRTVYNFQQRQLQKAARIIAISEATKKDLQDYLPQITADKISVVPLAAAKLPSGGSIEGLGVKRPYLLYVGGADFRKNVGDLIDAFDKIRPSHSDLQLVLVGKDFDDHKRQEGAAVLYKVDTSSNRAYILLLGYQSNQVLATLYAGAAAFVFPSLYEGFGMPVLEAMQAGCPVITYSNSSIPEVAGDAALFVKSAAELPQAIDRLLSDPGLAATLKERGLKQARHFSWERTAALTLNMLEEAANAHRR